MPSFQVVGSTWSNCSVVVPSLSVSFNPLLCNVVVESCDVDVVGLEVVESCDVDVVGLEVVECVEPYVVNLVNRYQW